MGGKKEFIYFLIIHINVEFCNWRMIHQATCEVHIITVLPNMVLQSNWEPRICTACLIDKACLQQLLSIITGVYGDCVLLDNALTFYPCYLSSYRRRKSRALSFVVLLRTEWEKISVMLFWNIEWTVWHPFEQLYNHMLSSVCICSVWKLMCA